jgi:hypothetical protein
MGIEWWREPRHTLRLLFGATALRLRDESHQIAAAAEVRKFDASIYLHLRHRDDKIPSVEETISSSSAGVPKMPHWT